MTHLLLLATLAVGSRIETAPIPLKSRIVEASVFKSGLVMLTREVLVPAGDGTYTLDTVPEATDGSFWYSSPDGLVVTDVETTLRTSDETVKVTAQTVGDYLAANVGQHVRLSYRTVIYTPATKETLEQIEGVVNGPPRLNTNTVPIKLSNGHLRNIALNNIEDIDTNGLKSDLSRSFKVPDLKIRFRAQANKPSRLDFVTLESGAAWVGSYLLKLGTNGSANVQGKAQVGLGRITFEDTTVKAIAGQPYLVSNTKYDLNSGVGGVGSYLLGDQEQFLVYHPGARDPYQALPQMASDAAQAAQWAANMGLGAEQYDGYNFGRGGYGGMGGGAGGPTFNQNIFGSPNASAAGGGFRTRDLATQATTDRLESLFAYPLGKVTLQAGDRLSRILFSQTSTYENLFRWSTEVGSSDNTVKNILRVHNTGTVPWTGGLVVVTKEDTPLAQLQMPFTPGGKVADLELANVQDILTKKEETEISRDTVPMPNRPKLTLQRELNEIRLSVESTRLETAAFELTLQVPGDVVDANGGKVEKLLTRPDGWNRFSRITWNFNLSPGDKREFKLQYRHVG